MSEHVLTVELPPTQADEDPRVVLELVDGVSGKTEGLASECERLSTWLHNRALGEPTT